MKLSGKKLRLLIRDISFISRYLRLKKGAMSTLFYFTLIKNNVAVASELRLSS